MMFTNALSLEAPRPGFHSSLMASHYIVPCTLTHILCHKVIAIVTKVNIYQPVQVLVVQTLDSAIHRINFYPADNAIVSHNTYLLDSDISSG